MADHSCREEIFPNIQPKSLTAQLRALSSHPVIWEWRPIPTWLCFVNNFQGKTTVLIPSLRNINTTFSFFRAVAFAYGECGSQSTPGWNTFPVELPAETQLCQEMSPAPWGFQGICALGELLVSDPAGKKAWKKQQPPSQDLCPAIPQQKSLL